MSEPQESFRQHRSCARQLQYLKLLLEGAKLHHKNICIAMLDIKSAFDTVDHTCLFRILQGLGIPLDAIAVIKDLHMQATTSILTGQCQTQPIRLCRGTIQGDTLSPLLFILYMEPLLRWLQLNDRGYRCASCSPTSPHYANVLAAADDLALVSHDTQQLQVQLNQMQAFADWSGMQVAPAKCIASAVLWGSHQQNTLHQLLIGMLYSPCSRRSEYMVLLCTAYPPRIPFDI